MLTSVYDRSSKDLAPAIARLLDHEHLVIQDPDVDKEADARFRKRPSLAFSDCLIVEIARKAGHMALGTFDRDLARIEGAERI